MIPLRDTIPSRRFPVMTLLIILACLAVFALQLKIIRLNPDNYQNMVRHFGLIPARAHSNFYPNQATLLPFISYMFLHGGWMHIIGNLWALWLFGDNVEDRMGPVRFLLFYLISGVLAGTVHYLSDPTSASVTIGASGAIAGVMGAYFVMYPRSRIVTLIPIFFIPLFIEIPALIYLGFWLITQVYSMVLTHGAGNVSNIAWSAHVGGFVAGMVLHPIFRQRRGSYN